MSDESWLQGDEYVEPGASDWVEWKGYSSAPINRSCRVEVQLRDGNIVRGKAEDFRWAHSDESDPLYSRDIVSYRVTEWVIDLDEVFTRPEWEGCPLPRGTVISTKLKNGGNAMDKETGRSTDGWSWHINNGSSIAKYRILAEPNH